MSTPQTQDDYLPTLIDVGPDTAYEVQTVLRSSAEEKKEGLAAIESLSKLHCLAKQGSGYIKCLKILIADCSQDTVQQQLLLDQITHWSDIVTFIRMRFNELLVQLNTKSVFFADKEEHLLNQYKFLYRRVIVLSKGENKLLPLAQSAGLYAGTESESHETVEEKTTTLNTLYGVPVCEVGNDVFTVIVTGFGSSENKHDMEVLLQNTFKNCGKILAVTAPRVGVTRGFVTFFAKEAHQNALKLNKKKNSEGWVMTVKTVNVNDSQNKAYQIKRKSASSGSSGTPKAVGVGTASSASSESASQRATSKESKTSKPAGGGTTGTTRRRASPRGGKGSWTPKAA